MSSTIDISLGAPCGAIRAIHGINNSPSIVEAAERQKARLRAHLDELDALFSSLQSRAFNGEL